MTPTIPEQFINAAEEAGACPQALATLRGRAWTVAEFAICHPRWIKWWLHTVGWEGDDLRQTIRLLLAAGRHTTSLAMRYAAHKMTTDEIAKAATIAPAAAIRYAGDRLSREVLNAVAVRAPREALRYDAYHLAPQTLLACAVLSPTTALRSGSEARRCLEELPPDWRALVVARALDRRERA